MGIPLALGRGCGRIGSKRLGISNRKNAGLTFCCTGKWYWGSSKNIEQFSKSCIVLIIDSYIKDTSLLYIYIFTDTKRYMKNGRSWSWSSGWYLFWRCANPTTRPWKRLEHPESPWKMREKTTRPRQSWYVSGTQIVHPGWKLIRHHSFGSCFFSKFSVDGGEQNLDWFDFCYQCRYDTSILLSKLVDGDCLMAFLASHGSHAE